MGRLGVVVAHSRMRGSRCKGIGSFQNGHGSSAHAWNAAAIGSVRFLFPPLNWRQMRLNGGQPMDVHILAVMSDAARIQGKFKTLRVIHGKLGLSPGRFCIPSLF